VREEGRRATRGGSNPSSRLSGAKIGSVSCDNRKETAMKKDISLVLICLDHPCAEEVANPSIGSCTGKALHIDTAEDFRFSTAEELLERLKSWSAVPYDVRMNINRSRRVGIDEPWTPVPASFG
jgi:hypothetical protein